MTEPNHIFTAEHIKCFKLTEHLLRQAVAYSEAYGGPVVDGTQYSPSDRAISHVERVWQDSSETEWEHFDWALTDLYDALDLVWVDGMLWRADDCPDSVHKGHFSLWGTWYCDTCDSPYCDRA